MKSSWALILVSVYGLSVRLLFTLLDGFLEVMSLTFLVIVPLLVGFLTIILPPARATRSGVSAFFKPWLTTLVLLVISIALEVEGAICWVMIYPFFSIVAGIGGLIAYRMRKRNDTDEFMSDWDKPDHLKLSALVLLPLLIGFVEADRTLVTKQIETTEEINIAASPAVVWQQLAAINEVSPQERTKGIVSLLGFPHHVKTVTDRFEAGGHRTSFFEKGLQFEEEIIGFEKERRLVLAITIDPKKISPDVLDEHIVLGGKHVDVLQDTYTLTRIDETHCQLKLSSRYTITTPFNWYAQLWAKVLMADILSGQLKLVERRSVAAKTSK